MANPVTGFSNSKRTRKYLNSEEYLTLQKDHLDRVGSDTLLRGYATVQSLFAASIVDNVIELVGHTAQVGFMIQHVLSGDEFFVSDITGNFISCKNAINPAYNGQVFDIRKAVTQQYSTNGEQLVSVSPAPIEFVRNGIDTQVAEDTAVIANNRPMPQGLHIKNETGEWVPVTLDQTAPYANVPIPVAITDITGSSVVNVTASGLNVKIVHNGADPSSIRLGDGITEVGVTTNNELKTNSVHNGTTPSSTQIGDGTTLVGVTLLNELKIKEQSLPLTIGQKLAAGSTSVVLASDVVPLVQEVHNGLTPSSTRIGDGTTEAGVTLTNELKVKDIGLPTAIGAQLAVASTSVVLASDVVPAVQTSHAGLTPSSIRIGDGVETANVSVLNELLVKDIGLPIAIGQQLAVASTSVVLASDVVPLVQTVHTGVTPTSTRIGDGVTEAGVTLANELKVKEAGLVIAPNTALGLNSGVMSQSVSTAIAPVNAEGTINPLSADLNGNLRTYIANAISFAPAAKTSVAHVLNNYASTPVTTAAYVEVIASIGANSYECEVFDSSGEVLVLAFGAAAAEVDQVYITPGGNGKIPLYINAGTRVSLKAVSANASVGSFIINCYS